MVRFANVYPNLNQVYMAGLMTAPMVLIEILLMSAMHKSVTASSVIAAASLAALVACFFLIREQTADGDRQFPEVTASGRRDSDVRGGAIQDARIGQESEIDQMKAILRDMDARG